MVYSFYDPDLTDLSLGTFAILDHVAQGIHRSRFADDAIVEGFATGLEGFDNGNRTVYGIAFLVGGEQDGQGAGVVGMSRNKGFDGGN